MSLDIPAGLERLQSIENPLDCIKLSLDCCLFVVQLSEHLLLRLQLFHHLLNIIVVELLTLCLRDDHLPLLRHLLQLAIVGAHYSHVVPPCYLHVRFMLLGSYLSGANFRPLFDHGDWCGLLCGLTDQLDLL